MTYFLHICKEQSEDSENKFLLISEQKLNGAAGKIIARIYFSHPPVKLELTEIKVATLPVSKQEIAELLNAASQRDNVSSKFSLFHKGVVKKNEPFKVFNYPSTQHIDNLLKTLDIKEPSSKNYETRTIVPDLDHELEGKHSIYWQKSPIANKRTKKHTDKWQKNEIKEANLLNKYNVVEHVFEKYSKKLPAGLKQSFTDFNERLTGYYDELELLADEIKSSGNK